MKSFSPENQMVEKDWYARSFGSLYPVLYAHRSVEAAEPEALAARERLRLSREDEVLDLCCGAGRHMVHLLGLVRSLTGLDYSPDLLRLARARLRGHPEQSGVPRLVRGDMRALPLCTQSFDAVVNFFTSFGYFFEPEENRSVVREVARVLRPGGRFYIDYVNGEYVRKTLVPRSIRETGGYTVVENRWIDDEHARVNKITEVLQRETKVMQFTESVRLYTKAEFCSLLEDNGLEIEALWGDHAGNPLDISRPRMIAAGRKVRT